ncbi:MAG: divergent polysaccharide deacetylase family protein [Candidatus Omnitrophota bacterium]|nr:divergent polysaccharide deacetylase family protein [Candidatus Omnitrophota bacterium]
MNKISRIAIFIGLIFVPIIFSKVFNRQDQEIKSVLPVVGNKQNDVYRPKIALIFDDFGESLKDLKTLYSLDIPVTLAIIPGLKFSKNIAYIGSRCGFSIFIHLPFQPKAAARYNTKKYEFINSDLSKREIDDLLRYYLNYIRVAIGVNNHMGSGATEDEALMKYVLGVVKGKGLIFIDSRTSLNSVAYKVAKENNLICGYNEGFLDSVDDIDAIEKKMDSLVEKAKDKGKIIIIAHPKENTFSVLKNKIEELKKEVEFVTIRDYFGM